MTQLEAGSEILKTDRSGRVRVSARRRAELLAEFDKSGLSGPRFAAVTGLKYQTLAGWLQKRRRQGEGGAASAVAPPAESSPLEWLETVIGQAQPASATHASALLVRLPSGASLEVASTAQVSVAAALLRAWEKVSC